MYHGGKLFVHKIDERLKNRNTNLIDPENSYIIVKDVRRPKGNFADDIIEDHKKRIGLVKDLSSPPQFWDYGEDETIPPGGTMFQSYKRNPLPEYIRRKDYSNIKDDTGVYSPNYVGAFIPLYIHYTINFDGSGGHTTDERYGRHYGYDALDRNPTKIKKWGRKNREWSSLNSVEKRIVDLDLEKAWIIMDSWKERFFMPGDDQIWSDSKIAQKSWLSRGEGRPLKSLMLDSESVMNMGKRQSNSYIRSKLNDKKSVKSERSRKKKRTKKKKTKNQPTTIQEIEEPF
jgi:hypothetical protein